MRSLLLGLVEPTREEKGCISYQLLQNNHEAGDFTFVEEWASDAAFDEHLAAHHVQAALSRAQSWLAAEPDIRRYALLA